jgi:hypothetical protein
MDERLSGFQGIDFQEGFDRVQARNILKALMDELHAPVLKSYPKLKYRRDGITIDGTSVWDCFGVKPFTADLHFTVSIEDARTVISLTIPNAAAARWRKLKEIIGDEDLRLQFLSNIETVRRAVPEIWIRIAHRHFKNRRSVVPDANLDFNFDTIGFNKRRKGVREFPAWSEAFQAAVHSKGNANLQLQVQARFVHKDYPRIRSHEFLEVAVKTIGSFGGLYISLSSR